MNKKILISIIVAAVLVVAIGAGIYFKDNVVKTAQNLQQTSIAGTLSKIAKEIASPPPLIMGGKSQNVVLLQSKVLAETNLQRHDNGNLPALTENAKLDEAAAAKANDMFAKQYFEHVSPSGVDPGKLVQAHGYDYIVAGENLILGNFSSEKEVVQDWMNSPGHRANILNTRYTEIGVAIIKGTYKGETVWIGVQEFGLPSTACDSPSAALKDQIDSQKAQSDAMYASLQQKKQQIDNTSPNDPAYHQMVDDYNALVAQYDDLSNQLKATIDTYNQQVSAYNNCVTGK